MAKFLRLKLHFFGPDNLNLYTWRYHWETVLLKLLVLKVFQRAHDRPPEQRELLAAGVGGGVSEKSI